MALAPSNCYSMSLPGVLKLPRVARLTPGRAGWRLMTSTPASEIGSRKEGASTEIQSVNVSSTTYQSIWWDWVDLILVWHDSALCRPCFHEYESKSLLCSRAQQNILQNSLQREACLPCIHPAHITRSGASRSTNWAKSLSYSLRASCSSTPGFLYLTRLSRDLSALHCIINGS